MPAYTYFGSIEKLTQGAVDPVTQLNTKTLEQTAALAAGYTSLDVSAASSPKTLTVAESQSRRFRYYGTRGSALTIIHSPAAARSFSVFNDATTQTLTIKVTSGGTGVAVASGQTKLIEHDGTNAVDLLASLGGGDFSSNTSTSVDSEIVLFSGTAGKTGKRATGSGLAKLTSGVLSTVAAPSGAVVGDSDTQTLSAKTLTSPVVNVTSDATGDLYYRNASGLFTRLPIGSAGQALLVASGLPSWGAASGFDAAPCFAYSDSDESCADNTDVRLLLGAELWDPNGAHSTSSNTSRLTCQLAGKYVIMASGRFAANTAGNRYFRLRLNTGATYFANYEVPITNFGGVIPWMVFGQGDLAVNDYVEFEVKQTSGGALSITGSAVRTYLAWWRIAA